MAVRPNRILGMLGEPQLSDKTILDPMLRILFWNQFGKDLTHVVGKAASTMRPDILAFCETGCSSGRTLETLKSVDDYHFTTGKTGERFHIFTRFPHRYIGILREEERFLILDVALPTRDRFLLMVLHGPSRDSGWTPTALALEMSLYASSLRNTQEEYDLDRSVIVGDFNMNPFDPGMVGAVAFNAVMDARQGARDLERSNGVATAISTIQCGICLATPRPVNRERCFTTPTPKTNSSGTCWTRSS